MAKKSHVSLKGQLLLDGGRLAGSFFHRSVVLVCRHDLQGAFGLVLTRASSSRLEDVLDRPLPGQLASATLFGGGPVQPTALSFLHSDPLLTDGNVMDAIQLGHDLEELVELGDSWSPTRRFRVFAGYAGWSPRQLDDELRREAWITHPATVELVFDRPPAELWRHILRLSSHWEHRLLADAPEDLGVN
jgi:putative transcriptional regulator